MEGKISTKLGMDKRILFLARIHRIDGFHTSIETDNQVIQIEAET